MSLSIENYHIDDISCQNNVHSTELLITSGRNINQQWHRPSGY